MERKFKRERLDEGQFSQCMYIDSPFKEIQNQEEGHNQVFKNIQKKADMVKQKLFSESALYPPESPEDSEEEGHHTRVHFLDQVSSHPIYRLERQLWGKPSSLQ